MTQTENVITHTYDLILYIVPQLGKYPKTQKFLLADRIQNHLMDVLELLVASYYSKKGGVKREKLIEVNLKLEQIRYLVRISKDLHCINLRRYELIQKKINDIGRQVGAWLKSLQP